MLYRRLAPMLAAVMVGGLAASGCSEQSAAIRVDDVTVSRSDFEDELDLFFQEDDLRTFVFGQVAQEQLRGELRESYTQEYVAAVAGLRVQFIVAHSVLADEGIELTDEDISATEDLLSERVPGGSSVVPEDRREAFVDDVATLTTLQGELGPDRYGQAMAAAVGEASVTVRTQYGTWDPDELGVTPPEGPVSSGGADSAVDGPTSG